MRKVKPLIFHDFWLGLFGNNGLCFFGKDLEPGELVNFEHGIEDLIISQREEVGRSLRLCF